MADGEAGDCGAGGSRPSGASTSRRFLLRELPELFVKLLAESL